MTYTDPDGYPPSAWDTSTDYGPRLSQPALSSDATDTSREAAASLEGRKLIADCWTALEYIAQGGATDDAIEAATDIHPNAVRARRGKLADVGYISQQGYGLTRTGRRAHVWVITQRGLDALERRRLG